MKSLCLILLFAARLVVAQTNSYPLLKCSNRIYTNATIDSVTPATVIVSWDGGGERIAITNLPPELLEQYHYDPTAAAEFLAAADKKKAARLASSQATSEAIAKAKGSLGEPQKIRVLKTINGQEVQVLAQGAYSLAYIHGLPLEVISFVDDYNGAKAAVDAIRYVDGNQRSNRDSPTHRVGDLTDSAIAARDARRHLTEIEPFLIERTTIMARKSKFINTSGFVQWEYVGIPELTEIEKRAGNRTMRTRAGEISPLQPQ